VLTINGDSGDNRISVTMDSTGTKINVSVDGEVASFALADVDSINIDAGDGDDVVRFRRATARGPSRSVRTFWRRG